MNIHRTPKEEEVKYNLLGQEISKVKDEMDIGVLIDDERLKKLKLPTIAYRRIRGEMIATYKIINEKYDPEASSFLKLLSSSGNKFNRRNNSNKIVQHRFKTSLRKNSFAIRVEKVWNKLPDQVINVPSTNAFKNRLDTYWKSEEIYYSDHRAEISGGNGSHIQFPDIDIIGESEEVAPIGASSGNHH